MFVCFVLIIMQYHLKQYQNVYCECFQNLSKKKNKELFININKQKNSVLSFNILHITITQWIHYIENVKTHFA